MIKLYPIHQKYVFPIFKNGTTSIESHCTKHNIRPLINRQARRCDIITIFFREPTQRFISGVHSYIEFERQKFADIDYKTILHLIDTGQLSNEHFIQQFDFICALEEFYKGNVQLSPLEELSNLITEHKSPEIKKITASQAELIKKIVPDQLEDSFLYKNYLGQSVNISELIKETKNALSSS